MQHDDTLRSTNCLHISSYDLRRYVRVVASGAPHLGIMTKDAAHDRPDSVDGAFSALIERTGQTVLMRRDVVCFDVAHDGSVLGSTRRHGPATIAAAVVALYRRQHRKLSLLHGHFSVPASAGITVLASALNGLAPSKEGYIATDRR